MSTLNEAVIYRQLAELLAGRLDFDAFWDWLTPLQRSIPATDPARRLLFSIIAKFDEYDSSEMSDGQLRTYLEGILKRQAALPSNAFANSAQLQ